MMTLQLLGRIVASVASIESAIVGGAEVPPGDFADVVLVVSSHSLCTGTLVAPDVVLTAGHCIGGSPKAVLVGSVDYAKPGGTFVDVKSATAYPDWQHRYDVGVVVLDRAVAVKPRAIARGCRLKARAFVQAVGFGLTRASGTGANSRLHQATLAVGDPTCTRDSACAAAVAPGGEFTASGDGADSCFGDSGGPLFLGDALIGVVSRGTGTGAQPCSGGGVYVRANKVASWIERTTGRTLVRTGCRLPADTTAGIPKSDESDGSDLTSEQPDEPMQDPNDDAGGCSAGASPTGSVGIAGIAFIAGLLLIGRRDTRDRSWQKSR